LKDLNQAQDVQSQLSIVNEVIAISGTYFSGTTDFYTQDYINITSGSIASRRILANDI
jgi:hypothetical protein